MLLDIGRGILGIVILLAICYAFSKKRSAIDWRLVSVGIGMQVVLALLILQIPFLNSLFDSIAKGFQQIIGFTDAGSIFLFGSLVDGKIVMPEFKPIEGFNGIVNFGFAFRVLPTILFFSALTAILYYLGILQKIIFSFAWLMRRTMRLTGAESLAMAANVFIGQTEAPLVIKPFLDKMTRSELFSLMTGGFATIAGSVFAIYVNFLGGEDADTQVLFAKHLLIASIISAPAAIVAAKMLIPETEEKTVAEEMDIKVDAGNNLLDAISKGTTDGLKLAVNVGAMLLVFTALVFMLNFLFINGPGNWFGWNESIVESTNGRYEGFSFTYIISWVFAPFAWIIGTPNEDLLIMGQLLGKKTVINEFIAYGDFVQLRTAGIELQEKSKIIATYALCGFANFASIGIQIGGIGALAPSRRKDLTELGLLALVGGTIASLLTAAIAGMIV
ncbi:MAG: nucleoside transporter C-terminal domain-containing protein [Bacteroidota bacterium]